MSNTMRSIIFCLLVLFGESLCSPSANQYVDNVLHTALQSVINNRRADPSRLGDFNYEYSDKTFFGKVHGKAEYTEGYLSGIAKVSRGSDCRGPSNTTVGTFINCTLNFNYLQTSYKGKVKYGVLPKVNIDAKAEISRSSVFVEMVKVYNEARARVNILNRVQVGQLTTKFTGLGPLNKQLGVLEENYRRQVPTQVAYNLETSFRELMNLAVSQVPMPMR